MSTSREIESSGSLLLEHRFIEALAYCEKLDASGALEQPDLNNWILALFNLNQYDKALTLASRSSEEEPDTSDSFTQLGVCQWFLRQGETALASWDRAISCKYQPLGDGIEVVALLLYGGEKLNQPKAIKKATTKLQKFWKARSTAWPSPLAGLLLEDIDWTLVERAAKANPRLESRYLCQALFWKGFMLSKLSKQEALRAFAESAGIGGSSVLETERYLAKWELQQV